MPNNEILNRRALTPLRRTSVYMTPAAARALADQAALLHVSQGSLVDTAVQVLAQLPPVEVAALLRSFKHLTDDEFEVVHSVALDPSGPGGMPVPGKDDSVDAAAWVDFDTKDVA